MRQRHPFHLLLSLILSLFSLTAFAEEVAPAKPFCWRISSNDGMVFLLGSLHICKPEIYPVDRAITQAFEESDHLVVEVDTSPEKVMAPVQTFIMNKGIYTDGTSIKDHVSEATGRLLEAYCDKRGLGLEQLGVMRPWLLTLQLTNMEASQAGFDTEAGVDTHFLDQAKKENKPCKEMETIDLQLGLLSSFSDEVQEQVLRKTLEEVEEIPDLFAKMQAAWCRGDGKALDDLIRESYAKEPGLKLYMDKMFDERNVGMAAKIEESLFSQQRRRFFERQRVDFGPEGRHRVARVPSAAHAIASRSRFANALVPAHTRLPRPLAPPVVSM